MGRTGFVLCYAWALLVLISGCGQESSSEVEENFNDEPLPAYLSGHMEMSPVTYTLSGTDYTSGRTRIWYSFHRADEDWENKPLFVMFNGGPGSSTAILLAWNTGRVTVDEHFVEEGESTGINPYSWTTMGNLLYIDARQTGFSYGLVEDPEVAANREEELGIKNHNFAFDAAEFVRVVLRFARDYDSIRNNEIFMVGESYGGTRATAIMNLLLNYEQWGNGERYYVDPAMRDEVQDYLDVIFPEFEGEVHPPERIATHFSRQIMIQPYTVGSRQRLAGAEALEEPGSPLYDIAEETGVPFVPCSEQGPECDPVDNVYTWVEASGRDVYYMSKPYGWLLAYFFGGAAILAESEVLAPIIGVELESMSHMYASEREEAFRGNDYQSSGGGDFSMAPREERRFVRQMAEAAVKVNGDLADIYGELAPHDMFYISYSSDVAEGFWSTPLNPYDATTLGDLMIENLGYVETFITDGSLDFRCYSPGVPRALAMFGNKIESVAVDADSFTVEFAPGLFGENGRTEVEVAFPNYPDSGHTISYCAPQAFLEDVQAWIAKTQ